MHALKDLLVEFVPLQKVANPTYRGLVGGRHLSEVEADETAHCHRVVQTLFDGRI